CRINAEDPDRNFAPSPGRINHWYTSGGRGVRVDTHVYGGYEVPPYYDSMIAKLIVVGATREIAIRRMRRALGEFVVEGIKTTIPLQSKVLTTSDFQNGNYDITWVENFLRQQGLKD
ncbi:MAG: acetyl-CoA carboxylase biotin carboxylase subunit, partial [Verrucomicrobiales bacterium]|nr:acetyl-CoA carboxylase biotin carboxylase subunit [Verrucomicrobiales bacterium]